jgi:hypothetical protein
MFRCQTCGTVVPPRTPSHRVVARSRPSHYPPRPRANHFLRWIDGKRKQLHADDPGGAGTEIVEEIRVCPSCAANHAAASVEHVLNGATSG